MEFDGFLQIPLSSEVGMKAANTSMTPTDTDARGRADKSH
jgi:hypothetical protein